MLVQSLSRSLLMARVLSVTVPVSVPGATIQIRFAAVPPIVISTAAIVAACAVLPCLLHAFLVTFLALILFVGDFLPTLFHSLPFTVGTLDAQSGDSDGGGILQVGFAPQLGSFFRRHFPTGNFGMTFVTGFHGRIQAVGSVDRGDGGLDLTISKRYANVEALTEAHQ